MRINLSRLTANLPQRKEYHQRFTPGLFRAIEAAHFETNSASIDWNGFTLEEAQQALVMAMNYVDADYAEEMDDSPNEGNAIHEFLHNNEFIYHFKKAKPMSSEDVDFF